MRGYLAGHVGTGDESKNIKARLLDLFGPVGEYLQRMLKKPFTPQAKVEIANRIAEASKSLLPNMSDHVIVYQ